MDDLVAFRMMAFRIVDGHILHAHHIVGAVPAHTVDVVGDHTVVFHHTVDAVDDHTVAFRHTEGVHYVVASRHTVDVVVFRTEVFHHTVVFLRNLAA